jgi:uncharacterized membrane protein YbhN (UPF0104 family)
MVFTMPSSAASVSAHTLVTIASFLWPRVRRWGLPVFGIIVLGLLASRAHKIDWEGAWLVLWRYSPLLLLAVLGLATASHALYGCFDLIGRRHTRHKLPPLESWAIAVTSYAFNLNLGSLVGGVAMRVRLYTRAGLDEATIAQIVGISLATNWLGYGLVAGSLFAAGLIAPPSQAHMGATALRVLGVCMVLVPLGYVLACALAHGRVWHVRGRSLRLPSAWLAVLQLTLSTTNWALMGAAMYFLLGQKVPYSVTLGVLMAASIIGVIMPIPGGLGVIEAVYLALLSGSVRQGVLMGAVLAYRALYYFLPLMGGVVLYVLLERYTTAHSAGRSG